MVEIYSSDARSVAAFRVYPTLADALGISLVALNASVIFNLNAWYLTGPAVNASAPGEW